MTQEDKDLLLKDLCARLPYGVKCYVPVENCTMELTGKRLNYFCFHKDAWGIDYTHEQEIVLDPLNDANNNYIVKPYLRPMSSMTDEEERDWWTYKQVGTKWEEQDSRSIDWLNKNHFDYRGLIPMNLALEAPEGMYNIKNK